MPQETVPLEYLYAVVSGFLAILGLLWLGVVWRVFVNIESRIVTLEEYKKNDEIRAKLMISQVREMLVQMELRLGNNLESKRASIESAIADAGQKVVNTIKNGGTK